MATQSNFASSYRSPDVFGELVGEFEAKATTHGRGHKIAPTPDQVSYYVGTTATGHVWMCYDYVEFGDWCIDFDRHVAENKVC